MKLTMRLVVVLNMYVKFREKLCMKDEAEPSFLTVPIPVTPDPSPVPFGATTGISLPVLILNMAVINTLFILQVRPTTSNRISLVKLLMLSI